MVSSSKAGRTNCLVPGVTGLNFLNMFFFPLIDYPIEWPS
ncbi:putative membrane protein [Chlamydia psittaci C6/98]|nr:putative membrane protein [Chlamydia psittaci 06-1683]EPP33807.1 putative membrane protein [Chlamydia psittaci C6/98]